MSESRFAVSIDGAPRELARLRENIDRVDELLVRDILQHEGAGAGADAFENDGAVFERRQDQRRRQRVRGSKLAQNIDSAFFGHSDIEQQNVGPRLRNSRDRLRAIFCFAGDRDLAIELQQAANSLPHQELIVRDENANHGRIAITPNPRPG